MLLILFFLGIFFLSPRFAAYIPHDQSILQPSLLHAFDDSFEPWGALYDQERMQLVIGSRENGFTFVAPPTTSNTPSHYFFRIYFATNTLTTTTATTATTTTTHTHMMTATYFILFLAYLQ